MKKIDVTRESATKDENSFVPSPNLVIGSVRPCGLWTVTAQTNRVAKHCETALYMW